MVTKHKKTTVANIPLGCLYCVGAWEKASTILAPLVGGWWWLEEFNSYKLLEDWECNGRFNVADKGFRCSKPFPLVLVPPLVLLWVILGGIVWVMMTKATVALSKRPKLKWRSKQNEMGMGDGSWECDRWRVTGGKWERVTWCDGWTVKTRLARDWFEYFPRGSVFLFLGNLARWPISEVFLVAAPHRRWQTQTRSSPPQDHKLYSFYCTPFSPRKYVSQTQRPKRQGSCEETPT